MVRTFSVKSLYLILENLSPRLRKKFGTALVNTQHSIIGGKILRWYHRNRPVDAYLVSFPKSGRTWLRLMIGHIFVRHFDLNHPEIQKKTLKLTPLAELNPAVPKVNVTHDDEPHWKKPHELETSKAQYRQAKVIFLSRDPRDVVVSAYFEQEKRAVMWMDEAKRLRDRGNSIDLERLNPFEGTLSAFIYEDVGSLDTILTYYNIWAKNCDKPRDFLLLRYEDLHDNPRRELDRLLKFLDIPDVSDEILSEAIELASFNNMRKMEIDNVFDSRHLKPADKNDQNSYKTRRGKVGGFKDYFSLSEIAYMDEQVSKKLSNIYGYKP